MSRSLSREAIAATALELLDQEGLEALSMRKLGARLGVEAMSLYHHVRNKQDLLNAVHELLLQKLVVSGPLGGPWEEVAAATVRAFLQLLRQHPQAIPLFASRSAVAPGSLQFVDRSLGILIQAGFSPGQALMAFQTFFTFVVGHALYHYGPRDALSFAPANQFPNYPWLAQLTSPQAIPVEEEFEFGLNLLITGLQSKLNQTP